MMNLKLYGTAALKVISTKRPTMMMATTPGERHMYFNTYVKKNP